MRVRALQTAEVRALALAGAGDEEGHVGGTALFRRCLAFRLVLRVQGRAGRSQERRRQNRRNFHETSCGV
jgi:hypothetical protein